MPIRSSSATASALVGLTISASVINSTAVAPTHLDAGILGFRLSHPHRHTIHISANPDPGFVPEVLDLAPFDAERTGMHHKGIRYRVFGSDSTAAARASTTSADSPGSARTSTTLIFLLVTVPVLSKTTVSIPSPFPQHLRLLDQHAQLRPATGAHQNRRQGWPGPARTDTR